MSIDDTSSSEFFEAKYRQKADPWDFASSPYESGRYDAIITALASRRYRRAFEPGCSVGVLTERLAAICDAVEAIDFSSTAVAQAQERCAYLSNVDVECASISGRMPLNGFDLIVLSEMGYYLDPNEWSETVARMVSPMATGGIVLATHWLGTSADHCMSGDQVHEIIQASLLLRLQHSERHKAFRLDRWERV